MVIKPQRDRVTDVTGGARPRKPGRSAKASGRGEEKPKLREPTQAEVAAISEARALNEARPGRVAINGAMDAGVLRLTNPHTDGKGWVSHLLSTLGTTSEDFTDQAFGWIGNAASDGRSAVTASQVNAGLALMGAINPRDELEAAIGTQIIAAHIASLDFLRRARVNAGEHRDTAVAYAGAATKLTRSMALLVETLGKHRSGGKQTHEVRYVYVNGSAVFGDHAQTVIAPAGGGSAATKSGQPYGPAAIASLASAPGLPMPGQDPPRDALPIASDAGAETLPDSRQHGRCANRKGEWTLSNGVAHPRAAGSSGAGAGCRQGRERP